MSLPKMFLPKCLSLNIFSRVSFPKYYSQNVFNKNLLTNCFFWKRHFGRDILGEIFWERHFGRDILGETLWERHFGRDILGETFWERHFRRDIFGSHGFFFPELSFVARHSSLVTRHSVSVNMKNEISFFYFLPKCLFFSGVVTLHSSFVTRHSSLSFS